MRLTEIFGIVTLLAGAWVCVFAAWPDAPARPAGAGVPPACVWVLLESGDDRRATCFSDHAELTEDVRQMAARRDCPPPPAPPLAEGRVALRGGSGSPCAIDIAPLEGAIRFALGLPLPLNESSARDFELLPGVGPALARGIVSTRDRLGGFGRVGDLLEVKGIGPHRLEAIRPFVGVP